MQDYQFIGMLVLGLSAIISLFVAIYKPLSNIEKRLTKIETNLDNIDKTLGGHSHRLDEHERRIVQNEGDIKILKMKNKQKRGY